MSVEWFFGGLGEMFKGSFHNRADATVMEGGDWMHLFKTKGGKVGDRISSESGIGLVGDEVDGLAGTAKVLCDFLIERDDTFANVDDKEDDICSLDGDVDLFDGGRGDDVVGLLAGYKADATSVDEREGTAVPLDLRADAIAGDTGHVMDNGDAAASDAIEQRGLANVGPSDDGDEARVVHKLFTV